MSSDHPATDNAKLFGAKKTVSSFKFVHLENSCSTLLPFKFTKRFLNFPKPGKLCWVERYFKIDPDDKLLYSFDDYDLFADVATRRGAFVLKVSMASVADEYIHQRTTTSQGDDDHHHNDHDCMIIIMMMITLIYLGRERPHLEL